MLSQPITTSPGASASAAPASAAKKRRRRAPATGAADDCFTCGANGIKCDRRRPYCGPCLDVGVKCRGYKTQLTWGIGVASRGKLRGLHLPIHTPPVDSRDARIKKRGDERTSSGNEDGLRSKRSTTSLDSSGRDYDSQSSGDNGTEKLSIITSYDFVNIEPHSSSSSAVSRTSSTRSTNSPAVSTRASPTLSGIPQSSMPSQRITQDRKSPESSSSYTSSYPAGSQPQRPVQSQQQQQYGQSRAHNYHNEPCNYAPLEPPRGLIRSPFLEHEPKHGSKHKSKYEPKYEPNFASSRHYPMSSAPSATPSYEMVTGVSSAPYHPSAGMTVTTTGVSYAPVVATMHATSQMMGGDHFHNPSRRHRNGGPGWGGVGMGMGNLHQQHAPADTDNLSDLLYEDVLGTF
ncbi:unnamed protein product, partial [Tuber aestivum]